jgi:hypothetical protein
MNHVRYIHTHWKMNDNQKCIIYLFIYLFILYDNVIVICLTDQLLDVCICIAFLVKRGAGSHSLTAGGIENVLFLYIKK